MNFLDFVSFPSLRVHNTPNFEGFPDTIMYPTNKEIP